MFYSLAMFPYPSGTLHLGHARVYTISDTLARSYKLAGFNVINPMGWDAFGLPAENAAIERNISPSVWTNKNIEQMRQQMDNLGFDFDWDREIRTCDPKYYKWTQWIFLQLYKAGLVYQKESYVNWDPVDQTVLANEQVDSQRRSWRSGAIVEKKLMKQWYIKISDYAETLLEGLEELSEWPENVKKMQQEWIGKSEGYHIKFEVKGTENDYLTVFTTRPETIYGCSFIAMAPDHPLVEKYAKPEVHSILEEFKKETLNESLVDRKKEKHEKKGIHTQIYVIHPLTGEEIPVYVANYILKEYGTGAIMGVPAHDSKDYLFAQAYNLPIKEVIIDDASTEEVKSLPYTERKGKLINSGIWDGLNIEDVFKDIENNEEKYGWIDVHTTYNIQDWLISRQRYWGTPIPIIHCGSCGVVPVPEDQLPVVLPTNIELSKKGSVLNELEDFIQCKCPQCGGNARRETETMDTFVDSSWYFMRFTDPHNEKEIFDQNIADEWLPVDFYVGGVEHSILHLLYSRFIHKFLYDEGLLNCKEPFTVLRTQGMVLGKTYRNSLNDKPIPPSLVEDRGAEAFLKETGEKLEVTWEKMSKSKFNGTSPEDIIEEYGADVVRLGLLFRAPIDMDLEWDTAQIEGQKRWLRRLWTLVQHYKLYQYYRENGQIKVDPNYDISKSEKILRKSFHEVVSNVTHDVFDYQLFNKAIANMMKFTNVIYDLIVEDANTLTKKFDNNELLESPLFEQSIRSLLIMLSPMAPHFSSEAWRLLHVDIKTLKYPEENTVDIFNESWPVYDPDFVDSEGSIDMHVHFNGKFRGNIEIPEDFEDEDVIVQYILKQPQFSKYLTGKEIKKTFVIRERKTVSIVLEDSKN